MIRKFKLRTKLLGAFLLLGIIVPVATYTEHLETDERHHQRRGRRR
jgi:hypothetical protein